LTEIDQRLRQSPFIFANERWRSIINPAAKYVTLWTPHDLRRTMATSMGKIGVQPHIIETAINHQSGHKLGVAGSYDRANYHA
jgi:integrase